MSGAGLPVSSRVAVVSRTAVADNVANLGPAAGGYGLLADLSADAFGHGLERSAAEVTAFGVDVIAVSRLDDAITLRDGGSEAQIIVWAPPVTGDLQVIGSLRLGVGVGSVEALRRAYTAASPAIWLLLGDRPGVETLTASGLATVVDELARTPRRPYVNLVLVGDDPAALVHALGATLEAGVPVENIVTPFEHRGGGVSHGEARMLTRVGPELFGLSGSHLQPPAGTRPAMSLQAPVVALKAAAADVGVSYGYTYRTRGDTRLALVPLGYGDGIDRAAGNHAPALLGGVRYTIAGRVAMDASVLDIGEADVAVGDIVQFFGDPATGAPSAQEWGAILGVPGATITASLTARVERRWT